MKGRSYFQFFREWYDSIQLVTDSDMRAKLYDIVCAYSLDGTEPTHEELLRLDAVGQMFWKATFPQLKASRKNFLNGCKSGGAPKGSRNAAKFKIPTREEVYAYFGSHHFGSDPDGFFDYNCSIEWEGCKKHFKTWQAAADRWEEKEEDYE